MLFCVYSDNITIGILDIAGFENLKTNSFEQMCINLVNEKLQSFMTRKIFSQELEIYKSEGIQLEEVEFKSNEDVLELFEKVRFKIFLSCIRDIKIYSNIIICFLVSQKSCRPI